MARLSREFKSKLKSYFSRKIGSYTYRNGWDKSTCPYCGKEGKFGINLSLNRCNCFRCGEHPSPIQLVMYLENFSTYSEVYHFINSNDSLDTTYVFKEEVELREHKDLYLPDGFKSLMLGTSNVAKIARKYVEGRGFDPLEVARMGWGYGTKGKFFGYLIIPFTESGKLVYYNARRFLGGGPRYNNPDTTDTGVGKSFVIYNKEALSMYKSVFLCEGAINAATMGERGIASGGKAISRYQVNEILKSPVERVIILLDPDAKDKAIELAIKLVNYKKVKVVFLPDGKDVNDLGKEHVLSICNRVHYQNYRELLQIKINHSL